MPMINLVQKSQLEYTTRIDSAFYSQIFLSLEQTLHDKHTESLGRVAYVTDGNHMTIAGSFLSNPGIRYLRGQDISVDMVIDDRSRVFIPEEVFDGLKRSHIFQNDVLVTIVGANTGLVALVHDAPDKLTGNCKLGILRARNIDPAYLFSYLASKYGQSQIQRTIRGGAQTGLILPDLKRLKIVRLSPKFEAIISKLTYDAHLKLQRSKYLYTQANQGFLSHLGLLKWTPKHVLTYERSRRYVLKASRTDAEHFQPKFEDLIARISKNSQLERLGGLVDFKKGIEVGRKQYTESGPPFWRVSNFSIYGMEQGNLVRLDDALYRRLCSQYEPVQNELLLTKDGTPGIAFYLNHSFKGIISSGILRLTPRKRISLPYLELVINSIVVQMQIEQYAGGSVIKHWRPFEIDRTLIPRLDNNLELHLAALVQESREMRRKAIQECRVARKAIELAIGKSESLALTLVKKWTEQSSAS